jgi:phosphotransferase system enzyme I (PtsI)
MKTVKGITASPGIVKGTACLYSEKDAPRVPHYAIDDRHVDAELSRFDEALGRAKGAMKEVIDVSKELSDKRASEIFNVHLMIMDDPVLNEKIKSLIKARLINAEHAVDDAFEEYIKTYQLSDLHFAELAHDTQDVKDRILASFSGLSAHFECPEGERHSVVVVSKRLTPSMVINITKKNILAFVTEEGGLTTHATILARSYNVPVIFDVKVDEHINCGDRVIIDGFHGKVFIDPDEDTERLYSRKIEEQKKKMAVCEVKKVEPSTTKKGCRVKLKANISLPGEMEFLRGFHYDGIGLLRTEFLFLDKEAPPTEDEQFHMYSRIGEEAGEKGVSLRLLDIGTDKMPAYLHLPKQENPDLGIRGARALDFFYDIYFTQAKAALRASAVSNIKILYPMASDINDIRAFRSLLGKAKAALKKEKVKYNKDIEEGVMIETPSAALMADQIFAEVDFANIGSNDLLQYTMAASRGNASVERRYHILHPALVKLIEIIVKAGRKNGIEVCLCGEIAGFEEFYPFFLGIGLNSFSVAASRLDRIKCELLHLKKKGRLAAHKIYRAVTVDDVDKVLGR